MSIKRLKTSADGCKDQQQEPPLPSLQTQLFECLYDLLTNLPKELIHMVISFCIGYAEYKMNSLDVCLIDDERVDSVYADKDGTCLWLLYRYVKFKPDQTPLRAIHVKQFSPIPPYVQSGPCFICDEKAFQALAHTIQLLYADQHHMMIGYPNCPEFVRKPKNYKGDDLYLLDEGFFPTIGETVILEIKNGRIVVFPWNPRHSDIIDFVTCIYPYVGEYRLRANMISQVRHVGQDVFCILFDNGMASQIRIVQRQDHQFEIVILRRYLTCPSPTIFKHVHHVSTELLNDLYGDLLQEGKICACQNGVDGAVIVSLLKNEIAELRKYMEVDGKLQLAFSIPICSSSDRLFPLYALSRVLILKEDRSTFYVYKFV